jgi:tetratricopeptide (TPR) repeat protein
MSFFAPNSAELTNIFTGMAIGQLQDALSSGATQRDALARSALSRGTERIQARDNEAAANEFRRAIAYSPQMVDSYRLLGKTYLMLGKPDEAIATYQRGMQMVPNDQSALQNDLATAYVQLGRYNEAEKTYLDVARANPSSPGPLTSLGHIYLQQGRLNEAEDKFNAVANLVPRDAAAHYNLGLLYNRQGRYDEAIQEFTNAIGMRDKYDYAYADLAQTYIALGKPDKAREMVTQLDFIGTGNADALALQVRQDLYVPQIMYADVRYSTFPSTLGPGTTVAQLDPSLATPGASKVFKMVFQFNKAMDPISIQDPFHWSISRAAGGEAGVYNDGANLHAAREASIMPYPIGVAYDVQQQTATVYFRVTQNDTGDALIDPKHWVFQFSGVASDGKAMDPHANQYSGYSRAF